MQKGERIRILRDQLGWSQRRLGDEIDVSRSLISMFEIGKRNPSIEQYEELADIFNVDVAYLRGKSDKTTVLPERLDYENKHHFLDAEIRNIANEISKNKELKLLFEAAKDVSAADLLSVSEILKALKKKEKGDDAG